MEYKKKPEQWWQDQLIHEWFKGEKRKLSKEAKARFEKKYGKKKKKRDEE